MANEGTSELFAPGYRLGPYEIQAKLGEGGMGHVYQALDHRLQRVVALKVLRGESRGGALREALAASALNHPNIVTVYEAGHEGPVEYFAMERVDGQNIARRGSRMSLRDALRYAAQIADALAAAHAAGIIHRDLKPGNIMVNSRGLVKVLDFGIAKMTAPVSQENSATRTITEPGRVLGTFAYMSPEQAEAKEVDARSDIFSFGCVLYELVTGHRAFEGDSSMATLAAVIVKDPRPVRELTPDLPRAVVQIVEGCLRKKREERWQSMADVKLMLDAAMADPGNAAPPAAARRGVVAAMIGAAVLLGAGGTWLAIRRASPPPVPERARWLSRVTSGSGLNMAPAISRDGHLLSWSSDRAGDGNLDIWVQQVGAPEPVRLTNHPADDSEPNIAPDNSHIAFHSERSGGGVYVAPTMGGEAVLLAPMGRNPRYSPNGQWIAYWEGRESGGLLQGSAKVFVIEAGGGQPRQLGTDLAGALYPVWSPDSKTLLTVARGVDDKSVDWWLLPVDGSAPRRLNAVAAMQKQRLPRVAWQRQILPLDWRESGVLFTANRLDAGNIWEYRLSDGVSVPVTRGPGFHLQAASAPDGSLAYASLDWKNEVWSLPVDADHGKVRGELRSLTAEEPDALSPGTTSNGMRLVYRGRSMGRYTIRARTLPEGRTINLVENAVELFIPRIGGDVVAYCDAAGNIYRVSARGGPAEQVCKQCGYTSGVSPDGAMVVYEPAGSRNLQIMDFASGRKFAALPELKDGVLAAAQFSPDSKWIAFDARSLQTTAQVFIAPVSPDGPVTRENWIPVTPGTSEDIEPAWSPNGSLLYYMSDRDGFRCIWASPLDAVSKRPKAEAFAVQHFHSARRSLKRILGNGGYPGLSAIPGQLVFAFGELTGNIWLER